MFPYRTIVEWIAEDESFVARAPAFEGLAAHRETAAQATHELSVAGEAMIAAIREAGRPTRIDSRNLLQ